jgi:hypothetical protein
VATRASSDHPVKRVVQTKYEGELVLEVTATHATLRPIRTRKGGPAEVVVTWGHIYHRALAARSQ